MKNRLTSSFGIFLLMVFGSVIASAQVTITLPNPSTGPNTSLMIPVNVSSLTGLNVVSYEFTAICDTTFVKFTGVDVAGTVSNGLSPLANYYVNGFNAGRMKVVCATIAPLSGSGVLLNLKATTQNLGGTTPIQLTGLILGESIPFTLTNGTVTITGGLRPPTITPVSAKTVAEVDTLRFTVVATDTNGLALNYSSSNLPIGATLGSSTGQFVWRPDYSQAGSYSPRIKVTNTGGAADSIVVAITVTNVNRKPVFNPVSAKTIKSSDTMSVVLSAVDPDNDPLTYSFVSITPSASTSPSVSGNILRWIPAFADIGRTYSLTVRVSDNIITGGGVLPGTDTLVVSVTVTAGVHPPTITPVSAKTVAEADTLRFTVVATDTNGLALTYSSPNLPAGATLGSSTGQFVWRPDFTQAGSYSPRIKVTNTGGATDSIVVTITVTNVNRKPVFNPVSAKTVKDSDTMSVALSAVDPDNDPLTYSFVSMSPSATTSPTVTGATLRWIPAFADTGRTYSLTVRVSDNIISGGGVLPGTDTLVVSVTVNRSRNRGDVDGNGRIQAADASLILKHVVGFITLSPAALWAAGVTGGEVSAASAAVILQAAAGIITIPNQ